MLALRVSVSTGITLLDMFVFGLDENVDGSILSASSLIGWLK